MVMNAQEIRDQAPREAQTVRVDNIAYIDFDEGVYCHVDADMAYQEGS